MRRFGFQAVSWPGRIRIAVAQISLFVAVQRPAASHAADQPQWGTAWTRNMVSSETNLPDSFDPRTGQNIKWAAELGTQTHSTPIVAGGRVYIGTNTGNPRDPKRQ